MKIAVAVVAGTLGLGGWHATQQFNTPNHPVSLSITPAASAETASPQVLRIKGRVQPKTSVSIRSTLSLPIVELPLKEGDRITKGGVQGSAPFPASVLAKLDGSDLKAALGVAEAKRDAQAAEIEVARVRLAAQESQVASSRVCLGEAERNWGLTAWSHGSTLRWARWSRARSTTPARS